MTAATMTPPPHAQVEAWLEQLRQKGVQVESHGEDEWILTKGNQENKQ